MRDVAFVLVLAVLLPLTVSSQAPSPSLPLGAGRPATEGITRTSLRDDAKVAVTRVHLEPNAAEPPHTHATDVVLVPVTTGAIELIIGDRKVTAVKPGEVQFVNRDVVHSLKNNGTQPFELIAIAIK